MSAAAVLSALLTLLPVPAARRRCIVSHRGAIGRDADAVSARYGVPVSVLLAVGYLESHLGCAPRSGGCWGAPISPRRRGTAGGPAHAAAALAWGYRRCTTTLGAVSHFRCGRCVCPHLVGYQPAAAVRLAERIGGAS